MSIQDLAIVDSTAEAAATCVVCGKDIPAGEGVTARFGGRTLRFKCPGCVTRFADDPDRYLSTGPSSCCDDELEDAARWILRVIEWSKPAPSQDRSTRQIPHHAPSPARGCHSPGRLPTRVFSPGGLIQRNPARPGRPISAPASPLADQGARVELLETLRLPHGKPWCG